MNTDHKQKKFRGSPFFQLPISINSDFGFRISGSVGPCPSVVKTPRN